MCMILTLKLKSKHGPLVGYKFHQKLIIFTHFYVTRSYSNNIQSWMMLSIQIRILIYVSFALVR